MTKQGVDDYLTAGHSVDDLLALATSEVKALPQDEAEERAGPYLVSGGVICHEKQNHDGPMTVPLCNFTARITEERLRDDGIERTLAFVLEGKLQSGPPLPPAEVSASQFASMGWTVSEWGSRAVVNAGQGAKDHLRAGIQMLSGDVPRRVTYTHIGWREVDGAHVYLHAGGAIGAPHDLEIQVDLSDTLTRYALPEPPTGAELRRAILASLGMLDTAPDNITTPLLAATYRAPLGGVDFGLHLVGTTGAGKSELAALAQQHYGAGLNARHLPGSFSSTANALEGLAFSTKDALAVVDDFAPEGSSYDIARYHATAARLLRAQGNNSARGRMRADGSLRPDRPPRGLILSTGEDTPKGHSIKARTLILELEPDTLDWSRLTTAQREAAAGTYAAAMSAYLRWLATDYPARTAAFRTAHHCLRGELQSTGHKRTVDAGAQLLATWETFITFATDTGALTAEEGARLWERVHKGVLEALEPQAALQAQSDPVARFFDLLTGLFTSYRAHLAEATTGDYPGDGWGWETYPHRDQYNQEERHRAKGDRIGWVEEGALYLEPGATYRALSMFARDQGEGVPVTERTLWKRLAERGHLLSSEDGKNTVKRTLPGAGRVRVLHLSPYPAKTGATGATGADAVQDTANRAPIPEFQATEKGQSKKTGAHADERAPIAPEDETPECGKGARETASQRGRAPGAPIAPEITGIATPDKNEDEVRATWSAEL